MRRERRHTLDGLLTLLVFGVFAACVLSVLLTGAGAYRRLTERDRTAYARRTAAQYLATRVRQADGAGTVEIGDFDGAAAPEGGTLLLFEDIDGARYCTRVYCHDGYLRELFSDWPGDLSPEDGEKILEAGGLTFARAPGGALTAELTHGDGTVERIVLALRGGEGAVS